MPSLACGSDDELQRALRGYLVRHPGAADGVAGIRLWWLPAHLQGVSDAQLRGVLDDLVMRNVMQRTALLDGTELYACGAAADPPPGRTQVQPRLTHH